MHLSYSLFTLSALVVHFSLALPANVEADTQYARSLSLEHIAEYPLKIQDVPRGQFPLGVVRPVKTLQLPPPRPQSQEDRFTHRSKWSNTGHIAIHEGSIRGKLLGYINGHKVVDSEEQASTYIHRPHSIGGDLYDIETHERMCITAGAYGETLGQGMKNFHMARTTKINTYPANTVTKDVEAGTFVETTVFTFNPHSREIYAEWVNPDGSLPTTYILIHEERIYFTGDVLTVSNYFNADVTMVAFQWIDASIP